MKRNDQVTGVDSHTGTIRTRAAVKRELNDLFHTLWSYLNAAFLWQTPEFPAINDCPSTSGSFNSREASLHSKSFAHSLLPASARAKKHKAKLVEEQRTSVCNSWMNHSGISVRISITTLGAATYHTRCHSHPRLLLTATAGTQMTLYLSIHNTDWTRPFQERLRLFRDISGCCSAAPESPLVPLRTCKLTEECAPSVSGEAFSEVLSYHIYPLLTFLCPRISIIQRAILITAAHYLPLICQHPFPEK